MESLGLALFPRINKEHIKLWNVKRNACCGFLNKKAGKQSTFSKGKWQKRWFVVKTELIGHDNYTLSYYHNPDDMTSSQTYQLEGASLETFDGNEFHIIFKDGITLQLDAESFEVRQLWVDTLAYVIEVATSRGRALAERVNRNIKHGESFMRNPNQKGPSSPPNSPGREMTPVKGPMSPVRQKGTVPVQNTPAAPAASKPFVVRQRSLPTVRLDMDVNSIPPRSTARMQFEEMFVADVCRSLAIDVSLVEVHSIKGMVGMDWLTLVEFDIYIHLETQGLKGGAGALGAGSGDEKDDEDENVEENIERTEQELQEKEEQLEAARSERRRELLHKLSESIKNPHSDLYNGFITCKLDPTYPLLPVDDATGDHGSINGRVGGRSDDVNNLLYSSDPNILAIMERYKDIKLPESHMDVSHFEIQIAFEGQVRTLQVPNPMVLRKRCCALYPFEIMQALGLLGTAQELWVVPKGLAPRGLPNSLSDPIYFAPSARADGNFIINASKLKANLVYDVVCEDYRQEVLDSLTEEEVAQIDATFKMYDLDADQTISKAELEELVRQRTLARRAVIDEKFEEFVKDIRANTTDEETIQAEIRKAEEVRRVHYQQVAEAQNKLMHMFDAADIDGNGNLSRGEFMLAEAWWLRCTLNPEQMHIF